MMEDKFNHIDLLFPSSYIKAGDLMGRQVVVWIEKIEARHSLKTSRGTEKKPLMTFRGKKKGLVLNKTNAKRIASLYGPKPSEWIGKPITIHAETVDAFGEVVEAIRVVPQIPRIDSRRLPEADPADVKEALEHPGEASQEAISKAVSDVMHGVDFGGPED